MKPTACIFLSMCCFGPAIYGQDGAPPPGAMLGKERLLPGGTVKMLIVASYGVQEDMVSGLPQWAENDRFDVAAKAPENTPVPTFLLMIRTLLAERFHLQFHNEEKVRPAEQACFEVAGEFVAPAVPLDPARSRRDAARVPRHVDGRTGATVAWMGGRGDGARDGDLAPAPVPANSGPTIFMALEEIGLKLESRRMPVQAIVVDRGEWPDGN